MSHKTAFILSVIFSVVAVGAVGIYVIRKDTAELDRAKALQGLSAAGEVKENLNDLKAYTASSLQQLGEILKQAQTTPTPEPSDTTTSTEVLSESVTGTNATVNP